MKIILFCQNHILLLLLGSYFIITAGIFYDIVIEPPEIGQRINEQGYIEMETILKGRHNSQYVIEGICAAGFFLMIGGGMILIDKSFSLPSHNDIKKLLFYGGCLSSVLGLFFIMIFGTMKF